MTRLQEPVFNHKPMTPDQVRAARLRYAATERKAESFLMFGLLFAFLAVVSALLITAGLPSVIGFGAAAVFAIAALAFGSLRMLRSQDLDWMESPSSYEPLQSSELERLADLADANPVVREIWKGWVDSKIQVTKRDAAELERHVRLREYWLKEVAVENRVKSVLGLES